MKKYFKYILVVVVSLMGISCNELLDMPSDGRTTLDEVFSQRAGVAGYLNSCYGYCPAPGMDRTSLTDEAQDADDVLASSRYAMWYADAVNSQNFATYSSDGSPWASLYQGIRRCNVFLQRTADIDAVAIGSSDNEIAGCRSQAYTLRALYYLQLIKRYGAVPLIDASSSDLNHDYSNDKKASFSEVVTNIIQDCRAALSVPETAFSWAIPDNSFNIISRSVPYAIMSQAVTYAASPLWNDGTYTWADATKINKEALSTLLTHDYSLFNHTPSADIAQNAYALYFITSSNDRRGTDKETIYQVGGNLAIWRDAGLPSTAGMVKSGPCPTQEMVDCYEMQATGLAPVLGYSDAAHLIPILNTASGYDPTDPYAGRDPRFYASIYYNEALRTLGSSAGGRDDHYPLSPNLGLLNHIAGDIKDDGNGVYYEITTTGDDPYIVFDPVDANIDWSVDNKITFSFDYRCNFEFNEAGMYFIHANSIDPSKFFAIGNIPSTNNEWKTYTVDLSQHMLDNYKDAWDANSAFRFDPMAGQTGSVFAIKNFQMSVSAEGGDIEPQYVHTYVGAEDGITSNNRRTTRTGYYLRKFNNWKSNVNNSADGAVRLFRLGEIFLNFAESAYQSDGPDAIIDMGNGIQASALIAVNMVRARAGMPEFPAGMTVAEFETKYRNERRVELAFEEHRYFDVRRWKILDQTDKNVTGMRITKVGEGQYSYQRIGFSRESWKEKFNLYPIDQDEVNKVLEFTGSNWQNPGWN